MKRTAACVLALMLIAAGARVWAQQGGDWGGCTTISFDPTDLSTSPLVHERIKAIAQLETPQGNDGVGPPNGPVHTRLLYPGSNNVFAS